MIILEFLFLRIKVDYLEIIIMIEQKLDKKFFYKNI